tara:strand:- start:232 stop:522 length:291 start_codon:yes stop_codon:yes gene_type:complete
MKFKNTERQVKYDRANEILDNNNLDELTEEIIDTSIDLMFYDEALEELQNLRESKMMSRSSYEISRSSLLRARQILIDHLENLHSKKLSEYSSKIG